MFKLDHATTTLKPIKVNTDLNVPANGQMTSVIGVSWKELYVLEAAS